MVCDIAGSVDYLATNMHGVQGAGGSNPLIPTSNIKGLEAKNASNPFLFWPPAFPANFHNLSLLSLRHDGQKIRIFIIFVLVVTQCTKKVRCTCYCSGHE